MYVKRKNTFNCVTCLSRDNRCVPNIVSWRSVTLLNVLIIWCLSIREKRPDLPCTFLCYKGFLWTVKGVAIWYLWGGAEDYLQSTLFPAFFRYNNFMGDFIKHWSETNFFFFKNNNFVCNFIKHWSETNLFRLEMVF